MQVEPCYNESDRPFKKLGRPATGYEKRRVIASIEHAQRNRLISLGLNTAQVSAAMNYCRRGYTVSAAVRLVLAGGMRRGLFTGLPAL